jgi:hypothetical protein
MNLTAFVIGQAIARNAGADQATANRVGVVQGVLGLSPTKIIVGREIARQQASAAGAGAGAAAVGGGPAAGGGPARDLGAEIDTIDLRLDNHDAAFKAIADRLDGHEKVLKEIMSHIERLLEQRDTLQRIEAEHHDQKELLKQLKAELARLGSKTHR